MRLFLVIVVFACAFCFTISSSAFSGESSVSNWSEVGCSECGKVDEAWILSPVVVEGQMCPNSSFYGMEVSRPFLSRLYEVKFVDDAG